MANNFENPYAAPTMTSISVSKLRLAPLSRSRFAYVVWSILGSSGVLSVAIAEKLSVSLEAMLLLFGFLALGPFSLSLHPAGSHAFPEAIIGFVIAVLTLLFLIRPSKETFTISMAGVIAWVGFGLCQAFRLYSFSTGWAW